MSVKEMSAHKRYKKVEKFGEGAHGSVFKFEMLASPPPPPEAAQSHLPRKSPSSSSKRKREDLAEAVAEESEGEAVEKRYVAIKKFHVKKNSEGLSMDAVREIKLLQELDHPNVMPVVEIFSKKANIHLVMELMDFDLDHVIKDRNIVIRPSMTKQYMRMLLLGIEHCHKNWILHRDIKPGNCLINKKGEMKLGDFGLAKIFGSPQRKMTPQSFTIFYRPPELLYGATSYGTGADMWAVGCVFAELFLRSPLFPGDSEIGQLSKIFEALGTPTKDDWPGMDGLPNYTGFTEHPGTPLKDICKGASIEAVDLMSKMLFYDPSKRISASDALAHPYFKADPQPCRPEDLPHPSKM